jgi:hypothetical protein
VTAAARKDLHMLTMTIDAEFAESVGNRSQAGEWRVTGLTSPLCEDSRQ